MSEEEGELKSYVGHDLVDTRICGLCGHHGTELVTVIYPPEAMAVVVSVGYCGKCLQMPAGEFLRVAGRTISPAYEPPAAIDPPVVKPFRVYEEHMWRDAVADLSRKSEQLAAVRKELRELKAQLPAKPKKKKG